jgi:PmbA protein
MEKLLEIARASCDQAEVYAVSDRYNAVSFADAKLHDIEGARLSGVSLRILKDGCLGTAWTRNSDHPERLVESALASLAGGVEAAFDLPMTIDLPALDTVDDRIDDISSEALVNECDRVAGLLKEGSGGEVSVSGFTFRHRLRILNTRGTDLTAEATNFSIRGGVRIPALSAGLSRGHQARAFSPMPDETIDEILGFYKSMGRKVEVPTGRMKVLFLPDSLYTLSWRILSGLSARSVHQGTSPIASRAGEKVLDGLVTVLDEPRHLDQALARPFDDEGVACDRTVFVEDGVLRSFFTDLTYAGKIGIEPTGHGYRTAMFGGDALTLKPGPSVPHLTFAPGRSSYRELIESMDRGIVLESVLGAHSGNIPNGDYSVGISSGLYVENGEIVGRVADAMVSGNAWDTLSNVVGIEDRARTNSGDRVPAILCDDVSVSGR